MADGLLSKIAGSSALRLLHATYSLSPEGGGVAEGLLRLAETARSTGAFESEVVCLDDPRQPSRQTTSLPVHALGPGLGKYGYTSRIERWLRTNAGRFDGVLVHGLWHYESVAVWKTCRGKIPYAVFPHGMLDPWFRETYPLKHLKKRIYWRAIQHRILEDALAVLFTGPSEAYLAETTFKRNGWRSEVVGFGTVAPGGDPERQIDEFRAACPEVRGKSFILFLGRLHHKKGCDLLIEAFARYAATHPCVDLVMAGPDEGGYQAKLLSLVSRKGVAGRVHFPGMLTGGAKWGAFRAAEVFALPSHQDNFGIAVAEALACGTPVLISNQVNIWREIAEAGAGIVDDDTLEGTARMLERWLGLPEGERARMAAKCRRTFERHFNMNRVPTAVSDVFLGRASELVG
jgi:glycosyltransferase involved in cell wall biosynthesis